MTLIKVKERGRETVNLGRRNIVINGAMQVAQRGTSFTDLGSANAYAACDRFQLTSTGTAGRLTYTQGADAPHHIGFRNSIKLACTTADTSIAAAEFVRIRYRIEGRDLQQIGLGTTGAKPITVSFYVKGNAAATYVCELQDHDNSKIATKSFTVGTTWSRVEITFPAETSGNKFDNDVNNSLTISWTLHAGSQYTSGTFDNTGTFATTVNGNRALSGQTSFFDSTNRTFFLTGVQLEKGDTATEFEHRSFAEELHACRRYFQKTFNYDTAPENAGGSAVSFNGGLLGYCGSNNSGTYSGFHRFDPEMRTTPTVVTYGNSSGHWGRLSPTNTGTISYNAGAGYISNTKASGINFGQNAAGDTLLIGFGHITADAEL